MRSKASPRSPGNALIPDVEPRHSECDARRVPPSRWEVTFYLADWIGGGRVTEYRTGAFAAPTADAFRRPTTRSVRGNHRKRFPWANVAASGASPRQVTEDRPISQSQRDASRGNLSTAFLLSGLGVAFPFTLFSSHPRENGAQVRPQRSEIQ